MAEKTPILLVDSDAAARGRLKEILSQTPYAAEEAPSAEAALEIVGRSQLPIVLLRLRLAEGPGLEVLGKILAVKPEAIVVMLSSPQTHAQAVEALKAGAWGYIADPGAADEVKSAVHRAEEWRRMALKVSAAIASNGRENGVASMKMKTDFISSISHELRNPLASIVGFATTCRTNFDKLKPGQVKSYLDIIMDSSQRLSRLIGGLINLTEIRAGQCLVRPERFEVAALIRESFAQVKMTRPDIGLDLEVEGAAAEIFTDRDKLEKVLGCLLENAMKYSPPASRILVGARGAENGRVAISVSDQGAGIPWEERQRVFEAFYRSTDGVNRENPGAGIGLTIAKEMVSLLGGQIWVEQGRTLGCTVTFTLPKEFRACAES